jgi:hypothetical protein
MLISVEKNFIFIHVAKTGGQALKKALGRYRVRKATGQWRRLLGHLPVPEGLDAQFGPHATARWLRLKLPRPFFDGAFKFALVRNPYDLAVSRYAYVREYAGHHQHHAAQEQSFADFLRAEKRRALWRQRDQTAMLYDFAGAKLLVDKVYRFEQIEEAYRDIIERLDLPQMPELTRWNASTRDDYRSYYGDTERKLVESIWARDLANFEYRF